MGRRVARKSAASTSLDRSAVNLALTMTVVVDVVLGHVSQIHATTVVHVSRARTAAAIPASVSQGLLVPDVSTRPVPPSGRRRPLLAVLVNVSTVADVKRRLTALQDVCVHRRGLDDIVRSLPV